MLWNLKFIALHSLWNLYHVIKLFSHLTQIWVGNTSSLDTYKYMNHEGQFTSILNIDIEIHHSLYYTFIWGKKSWIILRKLYRDLLKIDTLGSLYDPHNLHRSSNLIRTSIFDVFLSSPESSRLSSWVTEKQNSVPAWLTAWYEMLKNYRNTTLTSYQVVHCPSSYHTLNAVVRVYVSSAIDYDVKHMWSFIFFRPTIIL